MIARNLIIVTLILFCNSIYAQKEVLSIPFDYKSTFYSGKESLAISNKLTGELVIFIEDVDASKAFLLDKDLIVKSEVFLNSLPRSFKQFLGHQINPDGSYSIFYTNSNNKKYGVLTLDFFKKEGKATTLDFKLKKEVFVESVSHKGKFHLITATRNSNDINFYTYKNNTFTGKHTVSFAFIEVIKNDFAVKAYSQLVSKGFNSGSLVKMDNKIPNAIETTSKPNKLYIIDDNFVFTFNNNKHKTKIAKISPNTFEVEFTSFELPDITKTSSFVNYNSYIFDDKMFQIKSSSSSMSFTVRNLASKELLKSIILNKEDSITFKNTPIIQEGPAFIAGKRTREMEATSKFLRKISAGDIGIAAYKKGNQYRITLGSKKEIRTGGAPMMMPMGGFGGMPLGGFGPLSVSFNPTFYAYSGYASTKTVRIDCLFNDSFKHVEGEVPENIFDKIKAFEDTFKNTSASTENSFSNNYDGDDDIIVSNPHEAKLKNLFWHHNKLYFGYIDTADRNYHIIEFTN